MPSSRGSSQPEDQTHVSYGSCITGGFFTTEPLGKSIGKVTPGQMLRLSRAELSPWLSGMPTQEQAQYFPLNPVHSTMPPPPEVSEHWSQRVRDLFLSLSLSKPPWALQPPSLLLSLICTALGHTWGTDPVWDLLVSSSSLSSRVKVIACSAGIGMKLHGLWSQIVEGSNFDPTKDQEWFLQSFNYHQSTCYTSRAVLDIGDTMACWIVCFQLGIIAISFCSLLYKGKDKNHISQNLLPCMFLGSRLSMRQIQSGRCEACSNFQMLVTQSFPILWDPGTSAHQTPLCMEFSK